MTYENMVEHYIAGEAYSQEQFLASILHLRGTELYNLHCWMTNKYGAPMLGTGRVTYASKFCVFKVPITPAGFRDNDMEGCLIGTDAVPAECLAKTKLLVFQGIEILAMERLRILSLEEIRQNGWPEWVSCIDMFQVGVDRKGRIKAYDYPELLSSLTF